MQFSSKWIDGIVPLLSISCYINANVAIAREYLELAELSNVIDLQAADTVWALLLRDPDSPRLSSYPVVKEFGQYFLHLSKAVIAGHDLPVQIPISIRCKLDPCYKIAWRTLHEGSRMTDDQIALHTHHLGNLLTRGVTLVAFLEIIIAEEGPLRAISILTAVIRQSQNLKCLVHASEDQVANLLATYVRTLVFKIFRNPIGPFDEKTCHDMLHFSYQMWNLFSPYYNLFVGQRSSLFTTVIQKLKGIEIAFALWVFLRASNYDFNSSCDTTMRVLYGRVEDRFLCLFHEPQTAWIVPAMCIIHFLFAAIRRNPACIFFDLLHSVMKACCGRQEWETMWIIHDRESEFKRLLECRRDRRNKIKASEKEA